MILDSLIDGLRAAMEAAIDADESAARENNDGDRCLGIAMPIQSLAELIEGLEIVKRQHDQYRRTTRRVLIVCVVASAISFASAAIDLFRMFRWSPP